MCDTFVALPGVTATGGVLLAKNAEVEADTLANHIRTHLADPVLLAKDDFAGFFEARQRALVEAIEKVPGVKNVHDLHIWAVEPRLVMLTCHVMVDGDDSTLTNELLHTIRRKVAAEFGIQHLTIQMETQCGHDTDVHCNLHHLTTDHASEPLHVHR